MQLWSLLLDFWAGNTKLRSFYTRLGFKFAASFRRMIMRLQCSILIFEDRGKTSAMCWSASAVGHNGCVSPHAPKKLWPILFDKVSFATSCQTRSVLLLLSLLTTCRQR